MLTISSWYTMVVIYSSGCKILGEQVWSPIYDDNDLDLGIGPPPPKKYPDKVILEAGSLPIAKVTGSEGGPTKGPFLRYITTWYWAPGTRFSIIDLLEFTFKPNTQYDLFRAGLS